MALLKRELYRQVKGPEVTHADRCTLVFDTDAKNLYVEREVAHLDASVEGAIEIQTATMDTGKMRNTFGCHLCIPRAPLLTNRGCQLADR